MALDLCLVIMVCGLLGGRLAHVFYENWSFYQKHPVDIFKIWQGGFVFYGGFFAALAGSFLFLKIKKESFLKWADFFAPTLALGYALGRIGCFLNGCCYGQLCLDSTCPWPWMIELGQHGLPAGLRHPTQLYAVFWELCAVLILLWIEKKRTTRGSVFYIWLALHSVGRLIMEHYREDYRGPELIGFSLSTLLSFGILFFLFLLQILCKIKFKPVTKTLC